MEEKIPSFFRFEDLRIYGKSVDYSKWIINTLHDPRNENEKHLCQAFIRSAIDISLNIAEGSARNKAQFDHYLKISKTAIRECIVYSEIANRLGLLSDDELAQSRELLMEQTRMIGALIISLQRNPRRRDEDRLDDAVSDIDTDITFDDLDETNN